MGNALAGSMPVSESLSTQELARAYYSGARILKALASFFSRRGVGANSPVWLSGYPALGVGFSNEFYYRSSSTAIFLGAGGTDFHGKGAGSHNNLGFRLSSLRRPSLQVYKCT